MINKERITFGRRKSDIHYINAYSNKNYVTNKQSLENILRKRIQVFRGESEKKQLGYRTLHEHIAERFYNNLIDNNIDEKKAEYLINQCVPSHTSLRNFANGEPLGMKFLDSIAYVFDVKYIIANFGIDIFMDHLGYPE